ncbi:MAG: hypothetical protein LBH82_01375 [Bacteroidales bacterium]|jgi:hypothetical protein|nr:hypothetical protein [Bacteroidales bacterium]
MSKKTKKHLHVSEKCCIFVRSAYGFLQVTQKTYYSLLVTRYSLTFDLPFQGEKKGVVSVKPKASPLG